MDASTLAALSIAMDESRDAALRELLQERERDRMQAEDLRSFVAQRHFTASQLVPNALRPITWEAAYARRHNDLHWAHGTMRDALRWVRSGDDVSAERLLAAELGSAAGSLQGAAYDGRGRALGRLGAWSAPSVQRLPHRSPRPGLVSATCRLVLLR